MVLITDTVTTAYWLFSFLFITFILSFFKMLKRKYTFIASLKFKFPLLRKSQKLAKYFIPV